MRAATILFLFAIILAFAACDKTDCPYVDERLCDQDYRDSIANDTTNAGGGIGTDTGTVVNGFVFYDQSVFENYESKVMLEDFTGFRCSNCATAIATGANLKTQWGERITVVGLHVTFEFAAPIADPPEPFSTDFRTDAGEAYTNAFQLPGLPNGLVNRKDFGTGEIQAVGESADRVDQLLQEEPQAFIRFRDVAVNSTGTTIDFKVAIAPLLELTGDYNLTIGILEDGIIEGQKDGTLSLFPFTHDHVFRGNVNGLYGEAALTANASFEPNTAQRFLYSLPIAPDWVAENCYLFAYLHHSDTREIIQCEEVHFIP